jgi:hypothetical protein
VTTYRDPIATAKTVLALTQEWFPYDVDTAAVQPAEIAFAGLARCRRLLFGMVEVNNAPDLAGGFARTIFETWLWSMYLILEGDEAYSRMEVNDRAMLARHAKDLLEVLEDEDKPTPQTDRIREQSKRAIAEQKAFEEAGAEQNAAGVKVIAGELDIASLARRVSKLLTGQKEANAAFPITTYAYLYRTESYVSTHGGLGAVKQHMLEQGGYSGRIDATPSYRDPDGRRLELCTAMVGVLARRVGVVLAYPTDQLEAFLAQWDRSVRT